MKKYFFIGIAVILCFAIVLVVYGGYLNYTDEKKISERLADKTIEVRGRTVEERIIYPIIKLDAARLYSDNMADAIALVNGNIVSWSVSKNNHVKKGDLLATLKNEQVSLKIQQAASALTRAEASLAQATNAYNRQGRLIARNATSKEKYEESEAQFNAAKAAVSESKAQRDQAIIDEENLKIYAPIEGEVLILYNNEGAYLQAGTPVALVGNFETLRFSMTIDGNSSHSLSLNDKASLKFSKNALQKAYDTEYASGNQGVLENIEAKLVEITPPLNEPAAMRRIVWEVDNRARVLEPLTYNDVSIISQNPHKCIAIPLNALTENKSAAYTVNNGIVKKKQIKTGATDGEYIQIISGLELGDIVVVGNFEGLSDGTKVNVVL